MAARSANHDLDRPPRTATYDAYRPASTNKPVSAAAHPSSTRWSTSVKASRSALHVQRAHHRTPWRDQPLGRPPPDACWKRRQLAGIRGHVAHHHRTPTDDGRPTEPLGHREARVRGRPWSAPTDGS
jgi:hypothetical protein